MSVVTVSKLFVCVVKRLLKMTIDGMKWDELPAKLEDTDTTVEA